jgi:hypothetical protein
MKPLIQYAWNRYSQNGEDGIIEELCRRLQIGPGWSVEFGAWDGKSLSNTFNLLEHAGWKAVDIEADEQRYQLLLATKKQFPDRLHAICAMVGYEGENRLDLLLQKTPIPRDFDLLSIDIDSVDWQVWKAVVDYRPKIVVIESNNQLPPGVKQLHAPPRHHGASFSSLVELGNSKGYGLVCHTGNCFFVANEIIAKAGISKEALEHPEILFHHGKYRRERILYWGRRMLPVKIMNIFFKASAKLKDFRRR